MAYINRKQTEDAIRKYAEEKHLNGEQIEYVNGILKAISVVNEQPASNVAEIKYGHWIVDNSEKDRVDKAAYRLFIKCSECGKLHFLGTTAYPNTYDSESIKTLSIYSDYTFCGRCGAKMHE